MSGRPIAARDTAGKRTVHRSTRRRHLILPAPHAIPQKLLDQLADRGRLVAPVGPEGRQELLRITRRGDQFLQERLGYVSFVPLLGGVS